MAEHHLDVQHAKQHQHHDNRKGHADEPKQNGLRGWFHRAAVWFLIGGWVSALLQIAVLIAVIYWLRYGRQRAPYEIWNRTRSFSRFFWNWIRGRDLERRADEAREIVRFVRRREAGDVNVSTLLSLAALGGLLLFAQNF